MFDLLRVWYIGLVMEFSRRTLLTGAAALLARRRAESKEKLKVAIFSKHLQFLSGDELAKTAAELGFDGLDLTVRKGGHVEPERVRQELPGLVATVRRHGLEVPMVSTEIADAETPYAEDIVRTAAELGIRHYRFGAFKYVNDQPYPKQLDAFKPRLARLAALNQRYQSCAMYHTHSGVGAVGASIWDLHEIMSGIDPARVGINYDVSHATIEGGLGGWINSFHICGPRLRGIAVKDFIWEKNRRGRWEPAFQPLGTGMVDLPKFFSMVAAADFSGPLQMHFEYPLGGAENGKRDLTIPRAQVLAAMKRDVGELRKYLAQASL
jgi:sugar phosphate isomerase/epimerase